MSNEGSTAVKEWYVRRAPPPAADAPMASGEEEEPETHGPFEVSELKGFFRSNGGPDGWVVWAQGMASGRGDWLPPMQVVAHTERGAPHTVAYRCHTVPYRCIPLHTVPYRSIPIHTVTGGAHQVGRAGVGRSAPLVHTAGRHGA